MRHDQINLEDCFAKTYSSACRTQTVLPKFPHSTTFKRLACICLNFSLLMALICTHVRSGAVKIGISSCALCTTVAHGRSLLAFYLIRVKVDTVLLITPICVHDRKYGFVFD